MKHIDLFSGIGGFSLAFDNIFHEQKNKHVFVEIDPFCTEVLKKHWPDAEYHSDIKSFANTRSKELGRVSHKPRKKSIETGDIYLVTGGFPCQPFSQAGRRKGTSDDRYLWPEMFAVIRHTKPKWVIAENVGGLASWNDGMVLEQVCVDLESEGYEVQPFIIPAVAVNAWHRRDRIWIIATNTKYKSTRHTKQKGIDERSSARATGSNKNDSNRKCERLERFKQNETSGQFRQFNRAWRNERPNWDKHWYEVATALCRVGHGIPRKLDRNPRLKSLGNAIVPQVAEEIMKAIKKYD